MSYGAADANAGGVNCDGDGVGDLHFVAALVLLRVGLGLGPRAPRIVLPVVFFFVIFYVPLYIILRKK